MTKNRLLAAVATMAVLIATPAVAQDWERVFETVPGVESAHRVLTLDPEADRSSRDRYKLVPLADLEAGGGQRFFVVPSTTFDVDTNTISGEIEHTVDTFDLILLEVPEIPASVSGEVEIYVDIGGHVNRIRVVGGTSEWANATHLRTRSGDLIGFIRRPARLGSVSVPVNALEDPSGKPSAGRWLSLLAMVTAIGLAANHAAMVWKGFDPPDLTLILYFLIASMGGKLGQKAIELGVGPD